MCIFHSQTIYQMCHHVDYHVDQCEWGVLSESVTKGTVVRCEYNGPLPQKLYQNCPKCIEKIKVTKKATKGHQTNGKDAGVIAAEEVRREKTLRKKISRSGAGLKSQGRQMHTTVVK